MIKSTISLMAVFLSSTVFSTPILPAQEKPLNLSSVMPFLDYVNSQPSGDYKKPKSDLLQVIENGWKRSKRITQNGPTNEDLAKAIKGSERDQQETGSRRVCVRTMTMTSQGFLNVRECLDRKVSLAEAAEWFHYNSDRFIASIDYPGRFITYGHWGEVVGLYYSASEMTLNEVVFFSTSLK